MDKIVIWVVLLVVAIYGANDSLEISKLKNRLTKLEQQPKLELTCSIPDNKKRYVCRYVEIAR